MYPYNESNTSDGQSVTITVPNEQTAVEGSFDKDALITVAHSSGSNLDFYNVCGGIKFRVEHEGIDRISVFGPWKEDIAGTVKVTMGSDGKPAYSVVDGKAIITVHAPDEDGFKVGVWYYVVSLPMEFEDGMTIQLRHDNFWDDEQIVTRTINRTLEIKRSVWGRLTISEKIDLESDRIPSNQIWYKAPSQISVGTTTEVASHSFSNGRGIITFSKELTSVSSPYFKGNTVVTKVGLPDSVTSIGSSAFSNCSSLTSITIPVSVTSIGDDAFRYCSSLTSITIPSSVTSIGDHVFQECISLTSITIPVSVTSIGDDAFRYCSSLTSITIPSSVTSIGDHVFQECISLTSITIPDGVMSIGSYAFSNCRSLTSITIPSSMTSIGSGAFSNCSSLTSITIPSSVTSIGSSAFQECSSLKSIRIPNNVTSIGAYAFWGCSGVTRLSIGSGVTSIDSFAFDNCQSLQTILVYPIVPPSLRSDAFSDTGNCNIYVPSESLEAYKNAFGWKDYANRLVGM